MSEPNSSKSKAASKRPNTKSGAVGGNKASSGDKESSSSPRPRSKKALPSKSEAQAGPTGTPGLLTLSRPLEEDAAPPRKSTNKSKKDKKKAVAIDGDTPEPSPSTIHQLSSSAPEASRPLSKRAQRGAPAAGADDAAAWEMPTSRDAQGQPALNWQQQLMNAQPSSASNKAATISAGASKKASRKQQAQQQAAASDALTWQQELFNPASKAKRGPQFDVFADARDAETFGGSEDEGVRTRSQSMGAKKAVGGKGSKKAGLPQDIGSSGDLSLDDIFAAGGPTSAAATSSAGKQHVRISSMPAGPSTPAKRAQFAATNHHSSSPALSSNLAPPPVDAAAAAAYAGPNFHNSPSAASLPAPKFGSRMKAAGGSTLLQRQNSRSSTSSNGAGNGAASSDLDASGAPRSTRGATAPPAAMMSSSPSSSSIQQSSDTRSYSASTTTDAAVNTSSESSRPSTMDKSATIENLLARLMGGTSL